MIITLTAIFVLFGVPLVCCVGVYRDKSRRKERDAAEEALKLKAEAESGRADEEDGLLQHENPLLQNGERPVVELGLEAYKPSVETVDPVGDVTDFHSQQYAADTLKGDSVVFLYVETRASLKAKQLANNSCRKYEAVSEALVEADRKKVEVAQLNSEVEIRRNELLSAVELERNTASTLEAAAVHSPKNSAPKAPPKAVPLASFGRPKVDAPAAAVEVEVEIEPVGASIQLAAPVYHDSRRGSSTGQVELALDVEMDGGMDTARSNFSTVSGASGLSARIEKKGAHFDKDEKAQINMKVSNLLAKRKERQASRSAKTPGR